MLEEILDQPDELDGDETENEVELDQYQKDLLWKGVGTVIGLREQLFDLFSSWVTENSQNEFAPQYQSLIQKYVDEKEDEVYDHATTFSETKIKSLQQSISNAEIRNTLVVEIQADYLDYIKQQQEKVTTELQRAMSTIQTSELRNQFISKPSQN